MLAVPQVASDAAHFVDFASPKASEQSLQDAAGGIRRFKRWLSSLHPYGVRNMVDALGKRSTAIDSVKLGEYIACSAPLHLADGWNFLSRAFDAALHGDRGSAHHLAYYAELRAAMSLLASEGIGIFNSRHLALDSQMQPMEIGKGTHTATWEILQAWSHKADSTVRLLDVIVLEGQSLSAWLRAAGVDNPTQLEVAREWLRTWSIDLERFSEDQDIRNEMSYRPTRIRTKALTPVDPKLELVQPLFASWHQLEPSSASSGATLDISLLRLALERVVSSRYSRHTTLDHAVNSLMALDITPSPSLYRGLNEPSHSATTIFTAARVAATQRSTSTPILARALLMLRLASATTESLLAAAQLSKSDLEFWWAPLGDDLGFWENADDIDQLADLWVDVREALDEAELYLTEATAQEPVRSIVGCLVDRVSLTQFSRAPLWLLNLD